MLSIDDLLTDLDVLAVDSQAISAFAPSSADGLVNLAAKRRVAVDGWLRAGLEQAGLPPVRHLVRRVPEQVLGWTNSAYTDYTEQASDRTEADLPIGTVIASAARDALYIKSEQPFKALWVSLLDHPNIGSTCVCSPTYWQGGQWAGFNSFVDGTTVTAGVSFSGGGRLSWQLPTDWQRRALAPDTTWGYWLRVQFSAVLDASTAATHMLPVRTSRFTLPCVYKTLALLYSESWGAQRGEWREKAMEYEQRASTLLTQVVGQAMDEFTTSDEDEAVTPAMVNSVATRYPASWFTLDRG